MELRNKGAEIYIPDCASEGISRTTHMAIGAHQDDLEIMAYEGISQCYNTNENWFFGVVITNGAGSPRNGKYADFTDDEMQKIRKQEQKRAADIGHYGAVALLDYKSSEVKDKNNKEIVNELKNLIEKARPKIVYIHNLADKHDTHVASAIRTIQAIRLIPEENQPELLIGCEVWRGLDWMMKEDKVAMETGRHSELANELLLSFDSQIAGGKRYDLASLGRRLANATFAESHAVDNTDSVTYGMDLTALMKDKQKDIAKYVNEYIERFKNDVNEKITKF